jgi:hypothetical protein
MLAQKPLRLAVMALAVLLALGALLYPTDEKRVKEAAEALVTAANANPSELARALDTYASPGVSLQVSELPETLTGREALVAAVASASKFGQKLELRLESVEVTVEGKRARLNADLIGATRAEVPELRRPRHCVALFEKHAGHFRLVSAEVGAERRDQPEARP